MTDILNKTIVLACLAVASERRRVLKQGAMLNIFYE